MKKLWMEMASLCVFMCFYFSARYQNQTKGAVHLISQYTMHHLPSQNHMKTAVMSSCFLSVRGFDASPQKYDNCTLVHRPR
jgi:hypothetical protein